MKLVKISNENFPSISMSSPLQEGYHSVPFDFILMDEERELYSKAVEVFWPNPEDFDFQKAILVNGSNGTITGCFGGTIWSNKEGDLEFSVGENYLPVTIKDKSLYVGETKCSVDKSNFTNPVTKVTYMVPFISADSEDGEISFEIGFFFDKDKVPHNKQYEAIQKALKANDISLLTPSVKVRGAGGVMAKLTDVFRGFPLTNTPFPKDGVEFDIVDFEIQSPPEEHSDYGYSLIATLKEEIPWPVIYVDKKNGNMPTPFKGAVRKVIFGNRSKITGILVDQETGQYKSSEKVIRNWINGFTNEDGNIIPPTGFKLIVSSLHATEPGKIQPNHVGMKGYANPILVQAAMQSLPIGNMAKDEPKRELPFADDVIEVESVTLNGKVPVGAGDDF